MTRIRPSRTIATFAAALALSAASVYAGGPAPVAPAFRLSPCLICPQHNPAVAGAPSGTFMTAFEMQNATSGPAVQQRLFKASGLPAAPPAFVQAPGGAPQYDAAVASNALGAFVVAWSTANPLTHNSNVLAHRFDATGKALGVDIPVNVDDPAYRALDTLPSVAVSADGGFTVAWIRLIPGGEPVPSNGNEIWARRFTPLGVPIAAPVKVSTGLADGYRPSICIDTLKRAVVAWTIDDAVHQFEPSKTGVAVRRINPAGAPLGGAIQVAAPMSGYAQTALGCGAAGAIVIARESNQPPAVVGHDVLVQTFNANGRAVGPVVVVNTDTLGEQRFPV